MPGRNRRREWDSRMEGRFESEVRQSDMMAKGFTEVRKYSCEKCHRMFEEKSKNCPRCDSRSMGELRPIPEKHLDEARRNAIRRARRNVWG